MAEPLCRFRQSIFLSYNKPERKDRVGDNHGGVILYVKEALNYKRRDDLEIKDIEYIWIELVNHHKHILFYYRTPTFHDSSIDVYANNLNTIITKITNQLLQLCTARTAWSDSVIRSETSLITESDRSGLIRKLSLFRSFSVNVLPW